METLETLTAAVSDRLSDWLLIPALILAALWFTWRTGAVQITMIPEMVRQLVARDKGAGRNSISSFQAFSVSIASRVGTGNLAGVATAITMGGPGAVFWMWVIALIGAASAFIESTLAQIYKEKDANGGFRGGPAYYILKGTGSKLWASTFAVLICVTFGFAYNSVQANTISEAFGTAWSIPVPVTAIGITVLSLAVICGGLRSIARVSEWVVPVMAVAYLILAVWIIATNITMLPHVFTTIIQGAFGLEQAVGGTMGAAVSMGIRRGLFSNEAGEGSAPNVAATADVSHPVKQGLVQALGVFTDTLLICSCTAFIILCSGVHIDAGVKGISLTQKAVDMQTGIGLGSTFVGTLVFFFAFTSIIANYYYGETNIRFLTRKRTAIYAYRACVGAMVLAGGLSSLGFVWSLADITMSLMALCNLAAIAVLGRYAIVALRDYRAQKRQGITSPQYRRTTNPAIADKTLAWPE